MREQIVALKNHTDVVAQLGTRGLAGPADFVAANFDIAGQDRLQPSDATQQRALAGSAPADDGDCLAARHVQADAVQNAQRPELLDHIRDLHDGGASGWRGLHWLSFRGNGWPAIAGSTSQNRWRPRCRRW